MNEYIKLYNDAFNDNRHIEKYNKCKNCYGIILNRTYCDNKYITKSLCEKCYSTLKDEKCKNCNNSIIQEKNNRIWLVKKSYCNSCLHNTVCELCKNIKTFVHDYNYSTHTFSPPELKFNKQCNDCNHSIHTIPPMGNLPKEILVHILLYLNINIYNCSICDTYIDDYTEPIKCNICSEKICFKCTNELKCALQDNYKHIVCDNCFTSCKKKCNDQNCDKYDKPYCIVGRNCRNCKKTGCSACEIIITSCRCCKILCIDCHEGHRPIAQYCTSCYKTLHQCDKFAICNYCNSWGGKVRKNRIAPCQTCKFSYNIQSMYTNKEHCIGCQKDLIVELCDTHRDIKSTAKWKCCSLCNDYYCKKCKDKYNVRVCKKCRRVYCNDHDIVIKNGICSNCV